MRQRSLKVAVPSGLVLLMAVLFFLEPTDFAQSQFLAQPTPETANTGRQIQDQKDILRIEPGMPFEKTLSGGEVHTYEVNLTRDQFIHIVVDQRGIDVVVTLYGPDGKQILEVDSPNDSRGPEPVWYVSAAAGTHRVAVRSLDKEVLTGRYEIRIEGQRTATTGDRQRADAQRDLLRGAQLLPQKTEESSKQAEEEFNSALNLWRASGDRQGEADALGNIGQFYSLIDEDQKAVEYYDRALSVVRDLGDKRREADLLYLTGEENITSTEERKQKALSYYHQSLALMRAVGDRWGEARALNKIGLVYGFSGDTQKALAYFVPLLSLEKSLGERHDEAVTLDYIGSLHSNLGDFQKGLDYYNQALPLSRALGDREVESLSLRNMGTAYVELGDYERALNHFEEANRLNEKYPDAHGLSLNDIGAVHARLGDYAKALDYYNQALLIWRQIKAQRFEGSTLGDIGSAYRDLGDHPKAIEFYNQALSLKHYVGDRRGEAGILINLGKVQLAMGAGQRSFDYSQQAFEIGRAVADQNLEAQALAGMARAQRSLGNLEEARTRSEAALNIVESLRAKILRRELRTSYSASVQQYYETHINILMRLHQFHPTEGYDAAALQVTERARARSLVELLNEARVEIREGVDPALLARERSLRQQLRAKSEIQQRLLSGKSSEQQVASLKKETDDLLTMYKEAEAQIRINSPRYAALVQPVPLNLKEIQQLLAPDALLLEYSLGDERSYLWAVTNTSMNSFALPGRNEIEQAARHVYDLLTARNLKPKFETLVARRVRIAMADAEYPRAAALLAEMVLAPVAERLAANRLVIVSDGALQYVPFAALPQPKHNAAALATNTGNSTQPTQASSFLPLVVGHEIIDVPSASTLAVLRPESNGRPAPLRQLAVIADPVFEKNDQRVRGQLRTTAHAASEKGGQEQRPSDSEQLGASYDILRSARESGFDDDAVQIPRLPFTRREANEIAALVPAAHRKVSLDFAANRAAAMSPQLAQYRYVHFATHGFLNTAHPELSGIVLSLIDKNGQEQDGFLRAFEVFNLRLNADMVVLSGCRTGLGKEIRGEGLLGLTRGFMYAGARRVLVSLWGVTDEASAQLMVQTYKGMLGRARLRPAAALRSAQLLMLKDSRWQAPYYWAAFVLRGEPN